MSKPPYELAQVIRDYGKGFTAKHAPLKQHVSVLDAIQKCRTAALGGHVDVCDSCAHVRISPPVGGLQKSSLPQMPGHQP